MSFARFASRAAAAFRDLAIRASGVIVTRLAFPPLRAISDRCLAVSARALAGPPFSPPRRPSATACGFFFGLAMGFSLPAPEAANPDRSAQAAPLPQLRAGGRNVAIYLDRSTYVCEDRIMMREATMTQTAVTQFKGYLAMLDGATKVRVINSCTGVLNGESIPCLKVRARRVAGYDGRGPIFAYGEPRIVRASRVKA